MRARSVVRRVLGVIPTLFSVLVLTFLLVHASPGDPAVTLAGEGATPARVQEIRHSLGFDQPLPRQFVTYVTNLAHGDFGNSTSLALPVRTVIAQNIGPTLLLTGTALIISAVMGLLMGMMAARRPHGAVDLTINSGALLGYAMPGFWLGQIAVIVFALHLRLFPLLGYINARNPPHGFNRVTDIAYHLILPALVLATSEVALLTRITRSGLIGEMEQGYVVTARAKGLAEDQVVSHHAMRNVMLPVVTVIGTRIGFLLSGALIIETVFSWPGLGTVMRTAATTGDSEMVLGVVLVISAGVLVANLVTDLLYPLIDPRARAN